MSRRIVDVGFGATLGVLMLAAALKAPRAAAPPASRWIHEERGPSKAKLLREKSKRPGRIKVRR